MTTRGVFDPSLVEGAWFDPDVKPAGWFADEFVDVSGNSSHTGLVLAWSGSAWVEKPVKWYDGGSWVTKPLKRWTGSTWTLT